LVGARRAQSRRAGRTDAVAAARAGVGNVASRAARRPTGASRGVVAGGECSR
jgi:hypothetical protein